MFFGRAAQLAARARHVPRLRSIWMVRFSCLPLPFECQEESGARTAHLRRRRRHHLCVGAQVARRKSCVKAAKITLGTVSEVLELMDFDGVASRSVRGVRAAPPSRDAQKRRQANELVMSKRVCDVFARETNKSRRKVQATRSSPHWRAMRRIPMMARIRLSSCARLSCPTATSVHG